MSCPVVNKQGKRCSHKLKPLGNKTYHCDNPTDKHWLRAGIERVDDKDCYLEHYDPESNLVYRKYGVDCSELGELG